MTNQDSNREVMPSGKKFKPRPGRLLLALLFWGIIEAVRDAFTRKKGK